MTCEEHAAERTHGRCLNMQKEISFSEVMLAKPGKPVNHTKPAQDFSWAVIKSLACSG